MVSRKWRDGPGGTNQGPCSLGSSGLLEVALPETLGAGQHDALWCRVQPVGSWAVRAIGPQDQADGTFSDLKAGRCVCPQMMPM